MKIQVNEALIAKNEYFTFDGAIPVAKGDNSIRVWDSRIEHLWLDGLKEGEDTTLIAGPFVILKGDKWYRDDKGEITPFYIDATWKMVDGVPQIEDYMLTKAASDWTNGHTTDPYEFPIDAEVYNALVKEALPKLLDKAYKKETAPKSSVIARKPQGIRGVDRPWNYELGI